MRAIFFDEESARLAAARLVRDGFRADVRREAFAGEDDDADHPWEVGTDAPEVLLDLLCDEYDGWLDPDPTPGPSLGPAATPARPAALPLTPRRRHRPAGSVPERPTGPDS